MWQGEEEVGLQAARERLGGHRESSQVGEGAGGQGCGAQEELNCADVVDKSNVLGAGRAVSAGGLS